MKDINKKVCKPGSCLNFKYATIVFIDNIDKNFITMGNTLVKIKREVFEEVRSFVKHGALVIYYNNKLLGEEDVFLEENEFAYLPLSDYGYKLIWVLNEDDGTYELLSRKKLVSTITTSNLKSIKL